eukprot:TRINITY_DN4286_c0_g1_i6.p1 TRINITY_DN4286_c0_g1~~TRINITY_DN4286_c0_g1_i6.p1  ORF type:complete len:148 (+),score=14.99 TRINITY_DN4286_c0_g1_i6:155-598(+)
MAETKDPGFEAYQAPLDLLSTLNTLRDPINTFDFSTDQEVSFDLPAEIPAGVGYIRVLCFLRTGNEPPSRSFTVTISTLSSEGVPFYSHVMGARYPQNAISFSSTEHILPITMMRKIFVHCADKQLSNCHCFQLYVTGWSIQPKPAS